MNLLEKRQTLASIKTLLDKKIVFVEVEKRAQQGDFGYIERLLCFMTFMVPFAIAMVLTTDASFPFNPFHQETLNFLCVWIIILIPFAWMTLTCEKIYCERQTRKRDQEQENWGKIYEVVAAYDPVDIKAYKNLQSGIDRLTKKNMHKTLEACELFSNWVQSELEANPIPIVIEPEVSKLLGKELSGITN